MDDQKPGDPVSLEQALINLRAAKKLAADRAEALAPEFEKLRALQAELDTLPQHERRKVLNDAGLHHISAAPPPIKPVGSSSTQRPNPFDTVVKGPTNWKHWRHVDTVEIWQGLLLSFNIEPPGKGRLLDNALGRTGDIPREYLERHGLNDEFARRWFLVQNRLETDYASKGRPRPAELTNFLRLTKFAEWAIEFEWNDLPPELVALAKGHQAPETAAASSGTPKKAEVPAPEVTDETPAGVPAVEIISKFKLDPAWAEKLKHIARHPFLTRIIHKSGRISFNPLI